MASGKLRISVKFKPVDFASHQAVAKEPLGLMQITVQESKNMLNVEALKKSDPYCKLKLGVEEIGQTQVIENTLDPKWEAGFSTICHSTTNPLYLDFFDFNPVSKAKPLGSSILLLQDVFPLKAIHEFLDTIDPESKPELPREYPEQDAEKVAALEAAKRDGFKVDIVSPLNADLWCPIYISASGKKEARQKGHVHLHVQILPVVKSKVIRIEKKKKTSLKSGTSTPENIEPIVVPVEPVADPAVVDLVVPEHLPSVMSMDQINLGHEVFDTYRKSLI